MLTIQDTLDRHWTIITERAAVGFRWTVYCHDGETHPGALEMVYPGGEANGWTDCDHEDDRVRVLLLVFMTLKGGVPKSDDTPEKTVLNEASTWAKDRGRAARSEAAVAVNRRLLGHES